MEDVNFEEIKKRGNSIYRQELKSLSPKCNAKCVILFYSILSILFFSFGIPILIYSSNKIEYRKLYSNENW